MIEFNLLPDVKLKYVKTRRIKRLVTLGSFMVAVAALTVFVFLVVFVDVLQKKHIRDINGDIKVSSNQLQAIPNLNKILTIQNQLEALPGLHNQKPVASRLFTYMTELTPAKATMSTISVDFIQHTIGIDGDADNLSTVNQFADTLKFTTYTTQKSKTAKNAFSNVVLSSFGSSDKGATYSLAFAFDPLIFDESSTVVLTVPKITSTRSVTETDLFKQSSNGNKP